MTSEAPGGTLAVDMTAARTGGGASRARELAGTLAELAPERSFVFAVSRPIATMLTTLPPKASLMLVPSWLQRAPLRLAWEHLLLPTKLGGAGSDWILSPFNVLPLGPARGRSPRRALIVSNIGPFATEILASSDRYQRVRNALLRRLTLRSIRAADVVFLLSREAHDLLASSLVGKRVHFLPMAPPGPAVLREAASATIPSDLVDGPFFLLAGDLLPYKGVEDAVLAMRRLGAGGREARLLVVGRPMDAAYLRSVTDMAGNGNGGRVRFAGSLPQAQVLALMKASVATVVCSRVENTSRVPVEAMAVGSPVVIADRPYARDSCGDAALYYRAGDDAGLAEHLDALLDGPGAARELAERGLRRTAEVDWLSATRAILGALEMS
jgi:glycosyltransferase involved in cell wall biosynthesis